MQMNVSRFGGMAHIVRPKNIIERYIGQELAMARLQNPVEEVREWHQQFPFDCRQNEVVLLWGKDLQDAGNTDTWRFNEALRYAVSTIDSADDFNPLDARANGGTTLLGKTRAEERATLYKHTSR